MAFKKYAVAAIVLSAISGSVMAAPSSDTGVITFYGKVNPNTCDITMQGGSTSQNGNDFDVTLPVVEYADVAALTKNGTDSTLGETPFQLTVKCDPLPTGMTKKEISAQFEPWAASSASNEGILLPPTNVQGAAQNVAFIVKNKDGSLIDVGKINSTPQKATLDSNGVGYLNYKVAYAKTGDTVTSGNVVAKAAFTMNYE